MVGNKASIAYFPPEPPALGVIACHLMVERQAPNLAPCHIPTSIGSFDEALLPM